MTRIRRRGQTRGPYDSATPMAADPLARMLVFARVEAGLTQAQLARRLEIARSALAMYERGDRPIPFRLLAGLREWLPDAADWPVRRVWTARGQRKAYLALNPAAATPPD